MQVRTFPFWEAEVAGQQYEGCCTGDPQARLSGMWRLQMAAPFGLLALVLVWAAQLLLASPSKP